jgi:hypothetical protein
MLHKGISHWYQSLSSLLLSLCIRGLKNLTANPAGLIYYVFSVIIEEIGGI